MALIKEYIKNNVLSVNKEWESHIKNIFRLYNSNLKTLTPRNMLDVGCGDGSRSLLLAEYFNINKKQLFGLDYDQNLVNACNLRFQSAKIDLEVEPIPFEKGTFDVVVCNQVLEHLKNYRTVIDNLIRVTKKNGFIILGIPNLAHLINRIFLLFGKQPMCIDIDSSHVRGFTHKSFSLKLSSMTNVELIDCKGALMYPLPFFLGNFFSKHFIGFSGYVCYLLRKI